jgi:hypothetical protein
MTGDEPDIVDLMMQHELAIGRLYAGFAAEFSHEQDLWEALTRDEQAHADKLGVLRRDPFVNRWLSHQSGIKPQAVRSSIAYVDELEARARAGKFNLVGALSAARDLETALIELEFSKIDPTISADAGEVLQDLHEETRRHLAAVTSALEIERRRVS